MPLLIVFKVKTRLRYGDSKLFDKMLSLNEPVDIKHLADPVESVVKKPTTCVRLSCHTYMIYIEIKVVKG